MLRFTVSTDAGMLADKLEKRIPSVVRSLEQAVLSSCEPFVPYNTGRLCGSGHASGSGVQGEVTYSAAYASECYYASREFSRKKHPLACARWFEAAKAVDMSKWLETVRGGLGV